MATPSLDLVPDDYRAERAARRQLVGFGVVLALVVASVVGARLAIDGELAAIGADYTTLRDAISAAITTQQQVDELAAEKHALEQRLETLLALRQGARATRMISIVDHATHGDTWIRRWSYRREPGRTDSAAAPAGRKISFNTRMDIAGSAIHHAALSGFVDRLRHAPEITEVRILRTTRSADVIGEVINFDLAIVINLAAAAPS